MAGGAARRAVDRTGPAHRGQLHGRPRCARGGHPLPFAGRSAGCCLAPSLAWRRYRRGGRAGAPAAPEKIANHAAAGAPQAGPGGLARSLRAAPAACRRARDGRCGGRVREGLLHAPGRVAFFHAAREDLTWRDPHGVRGFWDIGCRRCRVRRSSCSVIATGSSRGPSRGTVRRALPSARRASYCPIAATSLSSRLPTDETHRRIRGVPVGLDVTCRRRTEGRAARRSRGLQVSVEHVEAGWTRGRDLALGRAGMRTVEDRAVQGRRSRTWQQRSDPCCRCSILRPVDAAERLGKLAGAGPGRSRSRAVCHALARAPGGSAHRIRAEAADVVRASAAELRAAEYASVGQTSLGVRAALRAGARLRGGADVDAACVGRGGADVTGGVDFTPPSSSRRPRPPRCSPFGPGASRREGATAAAEQAHEQARNETHELHRSNARWSGFDEAPWPLGASRKKLGDRTGALRRSRGTPGTPGWMTRWVRAAQERAVLSSASLSPSMP